MEVYDSACSYMIFLYRNMHCHLCIVLKTFCWKPLFLSLLSEKEPAQSKMRGN